MCGCYKIHIAKMVKRYGRNWEMDAEAKKQEEKEKQKEKNQKKNKKKNKNKEKYVIYLFFITKISIYINLWLLPKIGI